jgi:hypothetical protein
MPIWTINDDDEKHMTELLSMGNGISFGIINATLSLLQPKANSAVEI